MNIWRIHLLPGNRINQFGFCYQRNIIGIGWPIYRKVKTPAEYRKRMKIIYDGLRDVGHWKLAAKQITAMKNGDLVWARNHPGYGGDPLNDGDGRFYLGKVGGWAYRNDDVHGNADIVSIRRCRLHEVRASDVTNAGEDAEKFFQRMASKKFRLGKTVEQIHEANLQKTTKDIWKAIQQQI